MTETRYDTILAKNVMMPTREGLRLASDVYRPARGGGFAEGKFATILCRTAYDKAAPRYVDYADYFVPRGYAVVLQDVRGRHKSEGMGQYHHIVNPHEGRDGYDTVEWIAAQAWSNGKVGTVGSSYPGVMQVHMALARPPHLTAIWPDVVPINMFEHQSRMGGAMALQMFGALFVHAHDAQEIRDDPAGQARIITAMENMRDQMYTMPFKRGHTPLAVVPNLEAILIEYYTRGMYDEFWAQEANDLERYFDRHADIPATFSGGWYDLFGIATPRYYDTMRRQNTAPQRLIMGPWNHTGMRAGITFSGDVDFGAEGAWGLDKFFGEQLRFFDRYLRGMENNIEAGAPVQIFVMGGGDGTKTKYGKLNHGGHWRDEQEFPLARARNIKFYLGQDGDLISEEPLAADAPLTPLPSRDTALRSALGSRLGPPPPKGRGGQNPVGLQEGKRTFTFDPSHPVPTIGAACSGFIEMVPLSDKLDEFWSKGIPPPLRFKSIVLEGGTHQKEAPDIVGARPPYLTLDMRPDVLVFQTEPLAEDTEITGFITVKLWVSSSALDTDFTAKLIDVYPSSAAFPDGYHLNLTDAILRARFREGFEKETFLTPSEVVPITLDLAPTSNLFQKGHRIRLDISSSNFPRFDVNPNTGEPMGRHTHMVPAQNTVYCGGGCASYVALPIIPR